MKTATPRLLDTYREALRVRHYAWKTERSYVRWVVKFIHFCQFKTLAELKTNPAASIERFLTDMAPRVAASTQNQALSALLFLYNTLKVKIGNIDAVRAKRGATLTELPCEADVRRLLDGMTGAEGLACRLQFGCALRVSEAVRLRVKDIDFIHGEILVHEPKHGRDRAVMLPKALVSQLHSAIERSRALWEQDRRAKLAGVYLPHALAVKYPKAATQFRWHWLLPSPNTAVDPVSGLRRRHHLSIEAVQKAVRRKADELGLDGFHCHQFRHASAHALLMGGYQVGAVQAVLGHASVITTMKYLHSTPHGGVAAMKSPLD